MAKDKNNTFNEEIGAGEAEAKATGTKKRGRPKKSPEDATSAQIEKERERIEGIFEKAPDNLLKLASALIQRAAFLTVMLTKFEDDIAKNGYEEEYQNGQYQKGRKKTSAADLHVSYTKNLVTVMKQLHAMLDDADTGDSLDAFDDF